ncbi:MAG: translation initiation factor IF-2 [Planctomycetaceae bacterium]|nr:translation initiation factor IF-2 [Planctomycetaceae bacterium]
MKIRIFALAKELNIDSKQLIEHCAKAGVAAKNVLASITPEERDQVVAFLKGNRPAEPASTEDKAAAQKREEAVVEVSKVRPIRNMNTMVARSPGGRMRPQESEQPPEAEAPDEAEAPPVDVSAPADEADVSHVPAEAAEIPEAAPPVAAEADEGASDVSDDEGPLGSPDPGNKAAPLQRSDYVSASGAGRPHRVMQPMQARGTSDTQGSRQLASKPSRGRQSSVAQIAAIPNFKGPQAKAGKPDEPKAQKPDIKLTPNEMRSASPLAAHLQKTADKHKRRVDEEVVDDKKGPKKPGDRAGGMGLEESRQARRTKRPVPGRKGEEEGDGRSVIRKRRSHRSTGGTQFKTAAEVELPITVRTLSEAMGRPAKSLMSILFARGEMVTINTTLTENEALEIALELGVELTIKKDKDVEEELREIFEEAEPAEMLKPRPPIITILGHVDHGKTTLVDQIRSANVAAGEFGGITQHIAAYQVDKQGRKLTFVDTPGHAAFSEMRARGANVTDIVVLVVAANDSVMPQTIESIAHARAAGVPMVVALNKIDLPEANEQRVLQDLAAQNVLAAEWGGDVEVVRTSGLTGKGVDNLLDTLLLTAELNEYGANPERPACGVCLEAFRDEGRGPLVWFVVQKGTLKVGDAVLCGNAYGRIRAMYNEHDQELAEAPPSMPVKVAGLDIVPEAGDRFLAIDDMDLIRQIAVDRRQRGRTEHLANRSSKRTLEDILNRVKEGEVQDLSLIVKADTPGSLEALRHEIGKFEHPEFRVKILYEGIGGVNESDVSLASASNAVVIAFHVIAEDRAELSAQRSGVDIRRYNIIYEVTDDIRSILEGMLKPEQKEVITGRAIVLRLFSISRFGTIAGCRVLNGNIERSHRIHLIREQKILNDYAIGSLRREKDDTREVREGMECGIRLEGFNDIKEGDLLEAYKIEEIRRTLD